MGWLSRLFGSGTQKGETITMESSAMKEKTRKEVMKLAKDPVCGMEVDEKSAPAKSEYMGKTYYFCSPGCKKTFDANPAKYAGGGGHEMGGHGGHKM